MSQINTGSLNVNYPVAGEVNSTEGFRSNFTSIKNNIDIAATEITDLENAVILKGPLANNSLNNNMNNTLISNVLTLGFRGTTFNLGNNLSGTVLIDLTKGDLHYGVITGNTTLAFLNWAPSGTQSSVQVILGVSDPLQEFQIAFPTSVTYGTLTIENYVGTGVGGYLTVPLNVDSIHLNFVTTDSGVNIEVQPLNRPRVNPASILPSGTTYEVQFNTGGEFGSSSDFVFNNSSKTLTLGSDVLPKTSQTHNLGSVTNKWKDLYLSGSTIYLGNSVIKSNTNGVLNLSNNTGVIPTFGSPVNIGSPGDVPGMIKIDASYIYVSTGTFNGSTAIWKRAPIAAFVPGPTPPPTPPGPTPPPTPGPTQPPTGSINNALMVFPPESFTVVPVVQTVSGSYPFINVDVKYVFADSVIFTTNAPVATGSSYAYTKFIIYPNNAGPTGAPSYNVTGVPGTLSNYNHLMSSIGNLAPNGPPGTYYRVAAKFVTNTGLESSTILNSGTFSTNNPVGPAIIYYPYGTISSPVTVNGTSTSNPNVYNLNETFVTINSNGAFPEGKTYNYTKWVINNVEYNVIGNFVNGNYIEHPMYSVTIPLNYNTVYSVSAYYVMTDSSTSPNIFRTTYITRPGVTPPPTPGPTSPPTPGPTPPPTPGPTPPPTPAPTPVNIQWNFSWSPSNGLFAGGTTSNFRWDIKNSPDPATDRVGLKLIQERPNGNEYIIGSFSVFGVKDELKVGTIPPILQDGTSSTVGKIYALLELSSRTGAFIASTKIYNTVLPAIDTSKWTINWEPIGLVPGQTSTLTWSIPPAPNSTGNDIVKIITYAQSTNKLLGSITTNVENSPLTLGGFSNDDAGTLAVTIELYNNIEGPKLGFINYTNTLYPNAPAGNYTFIKPENDTSVREGQNAQFVVEGVTNTTLWWRAFSDSVPVASIEDVAGPIRGSVTTSSLMGWGYITVGPIAIDNELEAGESFFLRLYKNQKDMENGVNEIAVSKRVTILPP